MRCSGTCLPCGEWRRRDRCLRHAPCERSGSGAGQREGSRAAHRPRRGPALEQPPESHQKLTLVRACPK